MAAGRGSQRWYGAGRIGHTAAVIAANRPTAATLPGGRAASAALVALVALVVALVAACANPAVTIQPTSTPANPAASGAGPSGSSTPRPSARADPGQTALKAFVALVTKKGFSYQATFTGDSRHTTDILPIREGLLQVSGEDVRVRARFSYPSGGRYTVEHRYVGGRAWIRYSTSEAWARMTFRSSDSMGAFAAIKTAADVTYLGPVESGGTTFYKVRFRSAVVNPVMIPADNLSDLALTSPRLDLLIDATGRPVRGTAEIDGRGRVSGQLQEIVIDLKLTFTKVGKAVSISAP